MTSTRTSTFPTVLKDYMCENESYNGSKKRDSQILSMQDKSPVLPKSPTKTPTSRSPDVKSQKDNLVNREKSALSKESSSLSDTSNARKNADLARFEHNYRIWEQAKAISKQQRNANNKTRIYLQRELIKAHDALYEQHRKEAKLQKSKVRDARKAVKQAAEDAWLETCKESLQNDRLDKITNTPSPNLRLAKRRNKKSSPLKSAKSSTPDNLVSENSKTDEKNCNGIPVIATLQKRRTLTPFTDEDEGGFDEFRAVEKDFSNMPWYQEQLYRLYGNSADYYLHPVMVPKATNVVHPKLSEQGGRVGSEHLWNILRDESNNRLLHIDACVPKNLKAAYSSFIRQNLSPDKKPLERNFCNENDVPFMAELMNKSKSKDIANLRYKINIMHRLAKSNADKSRILTFNNPLPGQSGADCFGVGHYIPSWSETLQGNHKEITCDAESLTSEERTRRERFRNLIFLTEQDAYSAPQFRDKFLDLKKEEAIPEPFCDFHEKPVMCYEIDQSRDSPKDVESAKKYETEWKPLSMNALMEYTPSIEVKGEGPFRNGQPEMWRGTEVKCP